MLAKQAKRDYSSYIWAIEQAIEPLEERVGLLEPGSAGHADTLEEIAELRHEIQQLREGYDAGPTSNRNQPTTADAAVRQDEYRAEHNRSMATREDAHVAEDVFGARRTREWLRGRGYLALKKCTDLRAYGYQIIVWASPQMPDEPVIYEYAPVDHGLWVHALDVPRRRMTAKSIEEQQAIHRLLGVEDHVVCDTQQELF